VSAADVLAGVEESGPNYALPAAREGQRERRERLRVDETAKQAGHTIVEMGTHVEILGEQGLWWPATIAGREEDVDGRLVHEVEYDGYQGEQYWHMLDDEQWRLATATPAAGTNAAASIRSFFFELASCYETNARRTHTHDASLSGPQTSRTPAAPARAPPRPGERGVTVWDGNSR